MRTIKYTKTYFVRPKRINEEMYIQFKRAINQNPKYEINKSESISEYFKMEFTFLKYSFVYLFVFALILNFFYDGGHDKSTDPFRIIITIPAIIAGLGSFVTIFYLFLEGPSYATYLKDKRNYFESMNNTIRASSNYFDFCNKFYLPYE